MIRSGRPGWTGKIQFASHRLGLPLSWIAPKMVFVNSLSDLFHENVPFETIAAAFGVMAACRRHTFQILTKREDRMLGFFEWMEQWGVVDGYGMIERCMHAADEIFESITPREGNGRFAGWRQRLRHGRKKFQGTHTEPLWPLKNVWLGVSVENHECAERRIPKILNAKAIVKWISAEPLVGDIDFTKVDGADQLDWFVVGGESGPGSRPMDEEWVRKSHAFCMENRIPFHFKQYGALRNNPDKKDPTAKENGGHAKGGRIFDGRTWDEHPGATIAR